MLVKFKSQISTKNSLIFQQLQCNCFNFKLSFLFLIVVIMFLFLRTVKFLILSLILMMFFCCFGFWETSAFVARVTPGGGVGVGCWSGVWIDKGVDQVAVNLLDGSDLMQKPNAFVNSGTWNSEQLQIVEFKFKVLRQALCYVIWVKHSG